MFLGIQLAGIRLILEQKVLRLEEAVSSLSKEKDQMGEDVWKSFYYMTRFNYSLRSSSLPINLANNYEIQCAPLVTNTKD